MKKPLLFLLFISILPFRLSAGGYYVSKNDGDWNNPDTWNMITPGKKDYPTEEDQVLIVAYVVQATSKGAEHCRLLQVVWGGQLILNEADLVVNGDYSIYMGGSMFAVNNNRVEIKGIFLNEGQIISNADLLPNKIINNGLIYSPDYISLMSVTDFINNGIITVAKGEVNISGFNFINNGTISTNGRTVFTAREKINNNGKIEINGPLNISFLNYAGNDMLLEDGLSAQWIIRPSPKDLGTFQLNSNLDLTGPIAHYKLEMRSPQLAKALVHLPVDGKFIWIKGGTFVYNTADSLQFSSSSFLKVDNPSQIISGLEIKNGYLSFKGSMPALEIDGEIKVNGGVLDFSQTDLLWMGIDPKTFTPVGIKVFSGELYISVITPFYPIMIGHFPYGNLTISGGAMYVSRSLELDKRLFDVVTMTNGKLVLQNQSTFSIPDSTRSSICNFKGGTIQFGGKSSGKSGIEKYNFTDNSMKVTYPTIVIGNSIDSIQVFVWNPRFKVNNLFIIQKGKLQFQNVSFIISVLDSLINKSEFIPPNKIIFNGKYIYSPSPLTFSRFIVNEADHALIDASLTVQDTLELVNSQLDLKGNLFTLGSTFPTAKPVRLKIINGWVYNGQIRKWINAAWSSSDPEFSIGSYFPIGSAIGARPLFVNYLSLPTKSGFINVGFNETGLTSGVMFRDGSDIVRSRRNDSWDISVVGITGGKYELTAIYPFLPGIGDVNDLRLTLYNGVIGNPGRNGGSVAYPYVNRTNLSVSDLSHSFFISSIDAYRSPLSLVGSITSFMQNENDKNIKIYPNPLLDNEQEFIISLPDYFLEKEKIIVNVELINNVGEIIYSQQAIEVSSDLKIKIENVSLIKGIYILKLISKKQIQYTRLLVK